MKKLNFGCGERFHESWINIDFHSSNPIVQRVNLLKGFPFPDNTFDLTYSSHVLEHFTIEQSFFLLEEAFRVMKPDGAIRIVLPDLETSCREYIRILDMDDSNTDKQKLYEWITIELLDQLVRTKTGGEMEKFIRDTIKTDDKKLLDYIKSRTESELQLTGNHAVIKKRSIFEKIKNRFSYQRLLYKYIHFITSLIPKSIRPMIINSTSIGERHQWMFDKYGFKLLLEKVGFKNIKALSFNESTIPGFNSDGLDINADGSSYKNCSIYIEAFK